MQEVKQGKRNWKYYHATDLTSFFISKFLMLIETIRFSKCSNGDWKGFYIIMHIELFFLITFDELLAVYKRKNQVNNVTTLNLFLSSARWTDEVGNCLGFVSNKLGRYANSLEC